MIFLTLSLNQSRWNVWSLWLPYLFLRELLEPTLRFYLLLHSPVINSEANCIYSFSFLYFSIPERYKLKIPTNLLSSLDSHSISCHWCAMVSCPRACLLKSACDLQPMNNDLFICICHSFCLLSTPLHVLPVHFRTHSTEQVQYMFIDLNLTIYKSCLGSQCSKCWEYFGTGFIFTVSKRQ